MVGLNQDQIDEIAATGFMAEAIDDFLNMNCYGGTDIIQAPPPGNPREIDCETMLDCFEGEMNENCYHSMSICVFQPVFCEDIHISFEPKPRFGHASITLEQICEVNGNDEVTRLSFGLQPINASATNWNTDTYISSDEGQKANVCATFFMDQPMFNTILYNFSETFCDKDYDLNDYNCADYALEIYESVFSGFPIELPLPQSWFSNSPGILGQGLKDLTSDDNPYLLEVIMDENNNILENENCPE